MMNKNEIRISGLLLLLYSLSFITFAIAATRLAALFYPANILIDLTYSTAGLVFSMICCGAIWIMIYPDGSLLKILLAALALPVFFAIYAFTIFILPFFFTAVIKSNWYIVAAPLGVSISTFTVAVLYTRNLMLHKRGRRD
jgi:hypothetical protein